MPKENKGELTAAQELQQIEKRISVLRGVLRAYESEKNNPQILNKQCEYHQMQIEFHQAQLKIIQDRQSGNGSHIDDMKKNIKLAKKVWARLKNARAIEKLTRLYKEINSNKEDEEDEDVDQ